ncbi:LuxR C-terminal-related transcriptional regulator [Streptomyces sp. NPDC091287]|uniref:LuxR C-terminal-related transcriptional regulator n=1 Tax=Streptomyces sp. NPDC091287 TaxID=3365988 RepID=UPI0038147B1C
MLQDLGLTPEEEGVYRFVVGRPSTELSDLVRDMEPPRTAEAVAGIVASLVARGLVARTTGREEYVAVSPGVALGVELAERKERLQRAELALEELAESYRLGSMGRAQRDLVEVVDGRDAVQRRYFQMQLSARRSIETFVTGDIQVVGPENTQERTVLRRGIRLRAVVDQRFLSAPRSDDQLDESLADGVQVRTVKEIPLKLIICDNEVAMLPLHGRGADVDPSLVLRGGLVNIALSLFDTVWERARPYGATGMDIDAMDASVLRLLLAGLTDSAVASQLGLSSRTVQRRIKALMLRAGVNTRMQLGWHARHHGWA